MKEKKGINLNEEKTVISRPLIIYIAAIAIILIPWDKLGLPIVNAPLALLAGLVFAFCMKNPCPKFNG